MGSETSRQKETEKIQQDLARLSEEVAIRYTSISSRSAVTQREQSLYPNIEREFFSVNPPRYDNYEYSSYLRLAPSAPPASEVFQTYQPGIKIQEEASGSQIKPRSPSSNRRVEKTEKVAQRTTQNTAQTPRRLEPSVPYASEVFQISQPEIKIQQEASGSQIKPRSASTNRRVETTEKVAQTTTQKTAQTPRSKNESKINSAIVKCCTCNDHFGPEIYQCHVGHSACQYCRAGQARCGVCKGPLTNMRNFALEEQLSELKTPCRNKADGCILHFKPSEMESHLTDCLFEIVSCPANLLITHCPWKGKLLQTENHLKECHPDVAQSQVAREQVISNFNWDSKQLSLVRIGPYRFIVYHSASEEHGLCFTVQVLGTKIDAEKWSYEIHVYNKMEPRRKFTFSDKCQSIRTNTNTLINETNCAVLARPLALSYINEGSVAYKFYIRSSSVGLGSQCGRGARRKMPIVQ